MGKLMQLIRGIGQYINDWYDRYNQEMIEWRESDPESYYRYMNNNYVNNCGFGGN